MAGAPFKKKLSKSGATADDEQETKSRGGGHVSSDQVHGAAKALADKKNMSKKSKKKVAAKLKGMMPGKK